MENLDIILLNIVVIIAFIAFFISTFIAYESAARLDNPNIERRGFISRCINYFKSIAER